MADISRHFGKSAGSTRIRVRIAVPDLKFWAPDPVFVVEPPRPKSAKTELLAQFKRDLRRVTEPNPTTRLSDLPRSARIRAALAG